MSSLFLVVSAHIKVAGTEVKFCPTFSAAAAAATAAVVIAFCHCRSGRLDRRRQKHRDTHFQNWPI